MGGSVALFRRVSFALGLAVVVSSVPDWLVDEVTQPARVVTSNGTITLSNGLLSRTFTTSPAL